MRYISLVETEHADDSLYVLLMSIASLYCVDFDIFTTSTRASEYQLENIICTIASKDVEICHLHVKSVHILKSDVFH